MADLESYVCSHMHKHTHVVHYSLPPFSLRIDVLK